MKNFTRLILIGGSSTLILAMVGLTLLLYGITEDAIRLCIRETARTSVFLFLLVFVASPLYKITKSSFSRWLLINRRYLGIAFGISHLIHLALIACLLIVFLNGEWFALAPLSSYLIGGIGYLFIVAMLATSNNQSIKRIGHKRWKQLHKTGMYFLFATFAVNYAGLIDKNWAIYLPVFIAIVLAALIRINAKLSTLTRGSVA